MKTDVRKQIQERMDGHDKKGRYSLVKHLIWASLFLAFMVFILIMAGVPALSSDYAKGAYTGFPSGVSVTAIVLGFKRWLEGRA